MIGVDETGRPRLPSTGCCHDCLARLCSSKASADSNAPPPGKNYHASPRDVLSSGRWMRGFLSTSEQAVSPGKRSSGTPSRCLPDCCVPHSSSGPAQSPRAGAAANHLRYPTCQQSRCDDCGKVKSSQQPRLRAKRPDSEQLPATMAPFRH